MDENILNKNLLYDDKVASPRLKDIFHGINLTAALSIDECLKGVRSQFDDLLKQRKYTGMPKRFIGIFVPLDSYIPLPEPYFANFVRIQEKGTNIVDLNINVIAGCEVVTSINKQENRSRLSVVLACLPVSDKFNLEKIKPDLLAQYYERALNNVNAVIGAYKLTPLRHNHDLQFVSAANRDSTIQAMVFELDDKPVKQTKDFEVQSNNFAAVVHSRKMQPQELNYFRQTHFDLSSGNSEAYDIVEALIQAIDAKCIGDYRMAVIFADRYGELFLRFVYCHLLMKEMEPTEALSKTNAIVNIKSLINKIAQLMNQKSSAFKIQIKNGAWEAECRGIRNTLNHNFLKHDVSVGQAIKAINSSIEMVSILAELVEGENDETNRALTVFKSAEWLLKAQSDEDVAKNNQK
jgi:hypothetical protein